MDQYKPNIVAVIVAGVVMWVLGAVWYTIFGAQWMSFTGVTEEMAKAMTGGDLAMTYGGSIVAFALAFYVQDHILHVFKSEKLSDGIQGGFWSWLGFIATSFFVQNAYQMKPIGLWFIDTGYWLVGLIVGSIILVKMRKKPAVQ